jgi:hypothetical protein
METLYTAQYPMLHLKMNVPFILGKHLNYPSNLPILGPLQANLRNDSHAAFLLLKILSVRFFQPRMLTRIKKLGAGILKIIVLIIITFFVNSNLF